MWTKRLSVPLVAVAAASATSMHVFKELRVPAKHPFAGLSGAKKIWAGRSGYFWRRSAFAVIKIRKIGRKPGIHHRDRMASATVIAVLETERILKARLNFRFSDNFGDGVPASRKPLRKDVIYLVYLHSFERRWYIPGDSVKFMHTQYNAVPVKGLNDARVKRLQAEIRRLMGKLRGG